MPGDGAPPDPAMVFSGFMPGAMPMPTSMPATSQAKVFSMQQFRNPAFAGLVSPAATLEALRTPELAGFLDLNFLTKSPNVFYPALAGAANPVLANGPPTTRGQERNPFLNSFEAALMSLSSNAGRLSDSSAAQRFNSLAQAAGVAPPGIVDVGKMQGNPNSSEEEKAKQRRERNRLAAVCVCLYLSLSFFFHLQNLHCRLNVGKPRLIKKIL
eukprot:m.218670 g.218670  ORF g.218670 m.218670 type:complete len:213 (-) comp15905_c0_seq1:299-937(-)